MSEPSKKTPKKPKRKPNPKVDLPDDDAIRQLFPKKVVQKVNREIEHEPKTKENKAKTDDSTEG